VSTKISIRKPDKKYLQNIGEEAWREEKTWRTRRAWADNIKIGLMEVGLEDVYWINLADDRDRWRALVNTLLNIRILKKNCSSWR
jgi:hypothetical protein